MKVTSNRFQEQYIELYKVLRRYLWDIETVKMIADLELSVYRKLPNIQDIKITLHRLKRKLLQNINSSPDLNKVFLSFDSLLEESSEVFVPILNLVTTN